MKVRADRAEIHPDCAKAFLQAPNNTTKTTAHSVNTDWSR